MPTLADISGVLGIDVLDYVGGISQAEAKTLEFSGVMSQAVQSYNDLAGAIRMESQVQQQAAALMAQAQPQTSFTQDQIDALHAATEAKRADAQAAVTAVAQQDQVYKGLANDYVQNIGQMTAAEQQFLQLQIDVARAQASAGGAGAQQEVNAFKAALADEVQAVRAAKAAEAEAARAASQAGRDAKQQEAAAARQADQDQAAAQQQLASAASGLGQALNQAGVPAQALASGIMAATQAIQLMGSTAPATSDALLGLSASEMGVITTTLLLVQGLTSAANAYVGYADQIRNTSAMTGLSQQMVEGLDAAFRANGINAGQATLALGQMSEKAANLANEMAKGKAPTGNFADALAGLGIDARAFTLASADEQVRMFSDALNKHKNDANAVGLEYDVLGRFGKQLGVVFEQGSPYIQGWTDKVVQSGADVSQNQAQVLSWHKSLTDLHIEIQAVENQLGSGFIPVMKAGVDVLDKGAEAAHAVLAAWNTLPKPIQELGVALPLAAVAGMALVVAFSAASAATGVLGGLVAPLAAAWSTFTAQVGLATAALAGEAITAEATAAATAALVPELTIVAALGVGLVVVLHELMSGSDDAAAAQKRLGDAVDKTTSYLGKQAQANISAGVSPAAEIADLTQKYEAAKTQLEGYQQQLSTTKGEIAAITALEHGHTSGIQDALAALAAYNAANGTHLSTMRDLGTVLSWLSGQQSDLNNKIEISKATGQGYDNVIKQLQDDQSKSATAASAAAAFYANQAKELGIASSSALVHAVALEQVDKAVKAAGQSTAAGIAFQEASTRAVQDAARSDDDWAQRRQKLVAQQSDVNSTVAAAAKLEVELGDAYRDLGPEAAQAAVAQDQAALSAQHADQAQRQLASTLKQSADESVKFGQEVDKLGPLMATSMGQAAQQEVQLWRAAMAQVFADDVALTGELSDEDRKRLEAKRAADMAEAQLHDDAAQRYFAALDRQAAADKTMNDAVTAAARAMNDDVIKLTEQRTSVQHQADTLVESSERSTAQNILGIEQDLITGILALEAMRANQTNVYLSAIEAAELAVAKARLGIVQNEAQQAVALNSTVAAAAQEGARGQLAASQGLFDAQERLAHLSADEQARGEGEVLQKLIPLYAAELAAYKQLAAARTDADVTAAHDAINAIQLVVDATLQGANQIRTQSQDATKDIKNETSAISEQTAQVKDLTQANQDLYTAQDHLHTLDTKANNQTIAELQGQVAALGPLEAAQRQTATTAEQGAVKAAQGYADLVQGIGGAEGAQASLNKAIMANAAAEADAVIKPANDTYAAWNHTYTQLAAARTALDQQLRQLAEAERTAAKETQTANQAAQTSVLDLIKVYDDFAAKVIPIQAQIGAGFDKAGAQQVLAVMNASNQEEAVVEQKNQRVLDLERQLQQDLAPEQYKEVQRQLAVAQGDLDIEKGKYNQLKQLSQDYTAAFISGQEAQQSIMKATADAAKAIGDAQLAAAQASTTASDATQKAANDIAKAELSAAEQTSAAWQTATDQQISLSHDAAMARINAWKEMTQTRGQYSAQLASLYAQEATLDMAMIDLENQLAARKAQNAASELTIQIQIGRARQQLAVDEEQYTLAKDKATLTSAQLTAQVQIDAAKAQILASQGVMSAVLSMAKGVLSANTDVATSTVQGAVVANTAANTQVQAAGAVGEAAVTSARVQAASAADATEFAVDKALAAVEEAKVEVAASSATTQATVTGNADQTRSIGTTIQAIVLKAQTAATAASAEVAGNAAVTTSTINQAKATDLGAQSALGAAGATDALSRATATLSSDSTSSIAIMSSLNATVTALGSTVNDDTNDINNLSNALTALQTSDQGAIDSLNGSIAALQQQKQQVDDNISALQAMTTSNHVTAAAGGEAMVGLVSTTGQAVVTTQKLAAATGAAGSAASSAAGDFKAFETLLRSGTEDAVELQSSFDKLFSGTTQEMARMNAQAADLTLQMALLNQQIGIAPVSQNTAEELKLQSQIADLKAQQGPTSLFAPTPQELDLENQEAQIQLQMDQLQVQLAEDTQGKHQAAATAVQKQIDLLTKQSDVIKAQIDVLNQQTTIQKDQNDATTNGVTQQIAVLQKQYDQLQLNDAAQQADFKAAHAGQLQSQADLKAQQDALKLTTDVMKAQQDQLKANADAQESLTKVTLLSISQMETAYKQFVDYVSTHPLRLPSTSTAGGGGGGGAVQGGNVQGVEIGGGNISPLTPAQIARITGGNTLVAAGVPGFQGGTDYVPETMIAIVHKGEAVIPASENTGHAGGTVIDISGGIHLHIHGSTNMKPGQVAAAARAGVKDGLADVIRRGQLLSGRRNG